MVTPSFEAVVALRPDAVVGVQGPVNRAVLDRLVANGRSGGVPRVESMADVHTSIDVFAALVGRQAEAVALHARIRDEVARVEAAVRGRPKPRVLAVFGQRPLVVAGNGCWFDEVLQIAGGQDVVGAAGSRYPMVSIEQALAWQPEVVIDLTWHEGNGTLAAAWAGYTNLPAVAHGKVFAWTIR